jgi:hypothetical protein
VKQYKYGVSENVGKPGELRADLDPFFLIRFSPKGFRERFIFSTFRDRDGFFQLFKIGAGGGGLTVRVQNDGFQGDTKIGHISQLSVPGFPLVAELSGVGLTLKITLSKAKR